MSLWQKILFTLVFTLYFFIFYGMVYYVAEWWDPTLVEPPARIDSGYLAGLLALFTVLVWLAYVGAAYVLFGSLRAMGRRR